MDIIVENGTGVPQSNSYTTVSGVDMYASDMGYSNWISATEEVKKQSLFRAMRYIEGLDWKGKKKTPTQELAWPRAELHDNEGNLIPDNVIPRKVIEAVAEASILCLPDSTIELEPNITKEDYITGEQITGAVSVAYVFKNDSLYNRSVIIENKLKDYIKNRIFIQIIRS